MASTHPIRHVVALGSARRALRDSLSRFSHTLPMGTDRDAWLAADGWTKERVTGVLAARDAEPTMPPPCGNRVAHVASASDAIFHAVVDANIAREPAPRSELLDLSALAFEE